jgi:anti-sigma-K factor RskA
MTCGDFKDRAMQYALGVLDADERAACEAHLRQAEHDGCLEALRDARAAVALIPAALDPVPPAPETWTSIERRIAAASPAQAAAPAAAPRPRRWFAPLGWALAAAAIVAVIFLWRDRARLARVIDDEAARRAQCVAELGEQRDATQLQREALALLQRPGTRLVTLEAAGAPAPNGAPAATGNLIWHADDPRVYVVGRGLAAPPGKDLQLWAVRGTQEIPSGLLRGDASGAVASGEIAAIRDGAIDAFGVTLEPAGGVAGEHGPIVLFGKI